jgi:hypothetical protein
MYKVIVMTSVKMNHTTTITVLIAIAAVAAMLLAAGTVAAAVESAHSTFAHHKKGYSKTHSENSFKEISQQSNSPQQVICLTAGGNSPITDACINTASSADSNTGGAIGIGDHKEIYGISQQSNSPQQVICLTAGGNSPISGACANRSSSTHSNTGGIVGVSRQ